MAGTTRLPVPERWSVVGLTFCGLLIMTAAIAASAVDTTEALRMVIRATARSSLILFLLAFSAAGLVRIAPGPASRWLLRNRRQIGIGFALSHLVHAAAIIALARHDPTMFDSLTSPASFIFGGAAYLVIVAMLITSFDAGARAIGPSNWRRLHTFGIWFLWLMFAFNFGKRVPAHPEYILALVLALAALIVRLSGRRLVRKTESRAAKHL